MDNIFTRTGFEVPEQVRRFLQGESETGLRIEEYRDGTTLVVRTDLPGIDPENDVDITVADDALHIEARREDPGHRDQPGYRSELRYGVFSRTVPLPRGAVPEGVEASYVDGVLEIRVQVPDQPGPAATKIRVSRGGYRPPEPPQSPESPQSL
ncbi:Hsp20/alpha crystallin family protein [Arthrobacter sp. ov118]|jgi:HSP20 family protein|uniref:Hsp20/alpha crystallin family protein n=1 Tax=Arthrobacter sp. ov118 TaxID=1761747 RepID=UPI0008EE2F48|nr:Hsp20/alpha crystallin family protein [Arthrobacter sp. ov118]SFT85397.1 HSP20 family protein [Arthrobacter sp. ov118]